MISSGTPAAPHWWKNLFNSFQVLISLSDFSHYLGNIHSRSAFFPLHCLIYNMNSFIASRWIKGLIMKTEKLLTVLVICHIMAGENAGASFPLQSCNPASDCCIQSISPLNLKWNLQANNELPQGTTASAQVQFQDCFAPGRKDQGIWFSSLLLFQQITLLVRPALLTHLLATPTWTEWKPSFMWLSAHKHTGKCISCPSLALFLGSHIRPDRLKDDSCSGIVYFHRKRASAWSGDKWIYLSLPSLLWRALQQMYQGRAESEFPEGLESQNLWLPSRS